MEAELKQQQSAVKVSGSSIPLPDTSSDVEDEVSLPVNTRQINMNISVDFLAPKPIQDGSDLSNQWTRFKEEFDQFLTAAEKAKADDKVCIGPRENDIFKTFTFKGGKSKDKLC